MQGITLSVYRFQNTIADTILEEGHAMQQSKFDWHVRHSKDDDIIQLYRSELSDEDHDSEEEEGRDAPAE